MKYLIVTPNNINAAGAVLQYWQGGRSVHIGVWMSASLLCFVLSSCADLT
jgi:amino acid permease